MNEKLEIFNIRKIAKLVGIPYTTLLTRLRRAVNKLVKFKKKYRKGLRDTVKSMEEGRHYLKVLLVIETDPNWIERYGEMLEIIDFSVNEFKKLIPEPENE